MILFELLLANTLIDWLVSCCCETHDLHLFQVSVMMIMLIATEHFLHVMMIMRFICFISSSCFEACLICSLYRSNILIVPN